MVRSSCPPLETVSSLLDRPPSWSSFPPPSIRFDSGLASKSPLYKPLLHRYLSFTRPLIHIYLLQLNSLQWVTCSGTTCLASSPSLQAFVRVFFLHLPPSSDNDIRCSLGQLLGHDLPQVLLGLCRRYSPQPRRHPVRFPLLRNSIRLTHPSSQTLP